MSTEKLQKLADSKFDIKAAKLTLLERLESQLTFTFEGGLFKATPLLLATLDTYANAEYLNVILLDEYKNPIEANVQSIRSYARQAHQFALNAYLVEYDKLKKVRKGVNL